MLKRLSLAAAVVVGLSSPALAEPLKVVASFSILGDMAREVGGGADPGRGQWRRPCLPAQPGRRQGGGRGRSGHP